MRCREIRHDLPGFVRGELDSAGAARIAEHLAGCRACSEEARGLENVFGVIESKPWAPSPHYWSSILLRVHDRLEEQTRFPQWTTRFALPLAAALILAVGFFKIAPRPGEELPENFAAILNQLSSDELEEVADQQAVAEMIHPDLAAVDQQVSADEEVASVKAILQEEGSGTADVDAGVATGMDDTGAREADSPAAASPQPDSLN